MVTAPPIPRPGRLSSLSLIRRTHRQRLTAARSSGADGEAPQKKSNSAKLSRHHDARAAIEGPPDPFAAEYFHNRSRFQHRACSGREATRETRYVP